MKPETLELLDKVCNEEMSYEDGAALVWYVRNLMYFDLRLHKDHRVLLVNNDDLFINPVQHLKRIFGFISCPFDKDYANDILTLSTRKPPSSIIIDPRIEHLCQEMMYRLNEQYKLKMDNLY